MGILNLVFPEKCITCGKSGKYICVSCVKKVRFSDPICPVCQKLSIDGFTHIKCCTPYGIDGLVSLFVYEKSIRTALKKLKFKFVYSLSSILLKYSIIVLKSKIDVIPEKSIIVPIPLYIKRRRWRGFNQSEIIAKKLARYLKCLYISNALIRTKNTNAQSILDKKDRARNIHSAFKLNEETKDRIRGRNILLVDDIYTTGATLREATKVLKRNGVGKVWGFTIAR